MASGTSIGNTRRWNTPFTNKQRVILHLAYSGRDIHKEPYLWCQEMVHRQERALRQALGIPGYMEHSKTILKENIGPWWYHDCNAQPLSAKSQDSRFPSSHLTRYAFWGTTIVAISSDRSLLISSFVFLLYPPLH